MKKRLISFMLLITVISCFGFNTDYFKNLLTLISQAAKEVIYEETESYDEETTDSAVDHLEQELEKLDVRNFFEDESETESGSKTNKLFKNQIHPLHHLVFQCLVVHLLRCLVLSVQPSFLLL